MGKADLDLKNAIDRAVRNAWGKWVDGATSCQEPTPEGKAWQPKPIVTPDEADSEYEIDYYETYEDEEQNNNKVEKFTHTFYDDLEKGK